MHGFFARIVRPVLAVLLTAAAAAQAGELIRPVPDNAQITRFTRFNIRYSVRDIVADGVTRVDFFITDDMGGTWRRYGEDSDRVSPMTVEVPGEGAYGFVVVVTDRNGNREREPGPRTRPESVIVVDRTPPTAKWLAPRQDILGRDQTIEMQWESADDHLADAPVKIQYAANASGNHDRNANWQDMASGLPASGSHSWTPPDSQRYNFRLVVEDRAGNMAVAYAAATVEIDNTPPVVRGVQPLRSNRLENEIAVDAMDTDGGSGVKEFSLYYSEDGSATWTLLKEISVGGDSVPVKRTPGGTLTFRATRSGEYPLWPVVFDNAGNASALPSVAVSGPYVLTIDAEPPVVTLSSSFLQGRLAVLANEERSVEWTSYDPHLSPNSGIISLSLDNGRNWQEIRSSLATSGSERISFPFGSESEEARLRVTVADEYGNIGESVSEAFKLSGAETTIDSVTPRGFDGAAPADFGAGALPGDPALPAAAASWFGAAGAPSFTPDGSAAGALPGGSFTGFDPAGDIYGGAADLFGGGADLYEPRTNLNESTASTLPQAMLNAAQGGGAAQGLGADGAQAFPAAPQAAPALPPAPGGIAGWTSSAVTPPPAPAFPAAQTGLDGWIGSAAPATQSPLAPPAVSASPLAPPVAQPSTPADLFGGAALAPPPAPDSSLAPSLPPFPQDSGALSLDNMFGPSGTAGSLTPPPAGASPLAPPPASGSLAPPAPSMTTPLAAAAPSLPALPEGGTGAFSPPALTPSARPANPRLESNRLVDASKDFRLQGRPDLALDSARRAADADGGNPAALMELAQVYARIDPPDFVAAANLAKEATSLQTDWEAWWNCAEVFYLWAHASNTEIQTLIRAGQTPPVSLVDERNSTLNNAVIAINNAGSIVSGAADPAAPKKVAVTQGMITYLRALTIPQPVNTGDDEYRRRMAEYKATVTPLLTEALPFFQNALGMGGAPEYTETFQLGIINFRLAGLERDTGNAAQAGRYYQEAARYLDQATTAGDAPVGGPREAYYMLALSHEQVAELPGADRARSLELALRYWRQTADFYEPDSPYGVYARQRIDAISRDMGIE